MYMYTYAFVFNVFSSISLIETSLKKILVRSGLDSRYKRMHDQITDQLPQITLNGSPSQRQRCPEFLQGIPGSNLQFRSSIIFDNLRLKSQIIEYLNSVEFCWILLNFWFVKFVEWCNLVQSGALWNTLEHRHLDLGAEDRLIDRYRIVETCWCGLSLKRGSGGLATWICPLHVLKVRAFWCVGLSHQPSAQAYCPSNRTQ